MPGAQLNERCAQSHEPTTHVTPNLKKQRIEVLSSWCRANSSWTAHPGILAPVLFPGRRFGSAQGAARAVCNVLRSLGGYSRGDGTWKIAYH